MDSFVNLINALAAGNRTALYAAIAGIAALLLKFSVDLLNGLVHPTPQARRYIPLVCSLLGVAIGVLTHYAAGSTWTNAIIVGAAGPSAIAVNEIGNALKALMAKKLTTAPSDTHDPTGALKP